MRDLIGTIVHAVVLAVGLLVPVIAIVAVVQMVRDHRR